MEKTKLLQLLKTFDSKELRAFGDFVLSPFYNKNQEITDLFFYLKKLAPKEFPEKKLEKKYVSKIILPKEKYDEKRFNHLISQLLKLAEQFIGLREYEQHGVFSDYHTLIGYVKRGQEKNYNHVLKRAKIKLENYPYRDAQYYYQKYLISDAEEQNFMRKNVRQFDHSLQSVSDAFDVYFLSQKLKILVAMLDRERQLSEKYQHHMIDQVKDYISSDKFKDIPAIHIYKTMLLTLTEGNVLGHFDDLKKSLWGSKEHFSRQEIKELFYGAINYCINKIRTGEKEFARDLMELYEAGIDQELLVENGLVSPWTFKNMVKLGLGLKRFEWVETFVKQKHQMLSENVRREALHFNLADLNYHKKDYGQALLHLNKVEFSDIYYLLDSKVILLKIYFETLEEEAFLSLVQSFKIYLKRNQLLSENIKVTYLNFTNILYDIHKKGKEQLNELQQRIQKTTPLTDRSWLLQQLD